MIRYRICDAVDREPRMDRVVRFRSLEEYWKILDIFDIEEEETDEAEIIQFPSPVTRN